MAKKRDKKWSTGRPAQGPPGVPLEVGEAMRSFKGGYRHHGWGDPEGHGTYESHGDFYKTDVGGYSRTIRHRDQGGNRTAFANRRVASSDFAKLERHAQRQGQNLRAKMSRRYGGMSIPGKTYPLGIQKGHGMRGR